MKRRAPLASLAVLVWAVLAPASAGGQGFVFESTPRFGVTIVIEPSGDLLITETIVQEFGSTERHGIFRNIPNRLRYDNEFDRVYPIDLISVNASADTPDDVETKEENGNFVIRIGDPDTTITGRHTYEIVYRVEGAMNGFDSHDELFWNVIGNEWEQSIGEMNVRVSAPTDVTRVACFEGTFGSTAEYKAHADALMPSLLPLYTTLDPETYGGAMLVGVDGVCIISHGSSSQRAILNAINFAREMVEADVVGEISAAICPDDD